MARVVAGQQGLVPGAREIEKLGLGAIGPPMHASYFQDYAGLYISVAKVACKTLANVELMLRANANKYMQTRCPPPCRTRVPWPVCLA